MNLFQIVQLIDVTKISINNEYLIDVNRISEHMKLTLVRTVKNGAFNYSKKEEPGPLLLSSHTGIIYKFRIVIPSTLLYEY